MRPVGLGVVRGWRRCAGYGVFLMEPLERRRVLNGGHIDVGFPADSPLAWEMREGNPKSDRQAYVDLYPLSNGQVLTLRTRYLPDAQGEPFRAWVKRFNADGTPDGSFGTGGEAMVGWGGQQARILVQPDGKIVVHDVFGWNVTRLNADGSPDGSFGRGGRVDWGAFPDFRFTSGVVDVAVAPGGGLVFTANVYHYPTVDPVTGGAMVGRLRSDGTADPSFGEGGRVILGPQSSFMPHENLLVLADGSILIDNEVRLRRLTPAGAPDPTFTPFSLSGPDKALGDFVVQGDGKIVVISAGDGGLVRLNADGTVDRTFHRGGGPAGAEFPPAWTDGEWDPNEFLATRLLAQGDGKFVLVGPMWSWDEGGGRAALAVNRFNADGSPDRGFGFDGGVQLDYAGYGRALLDVDAVAVGTGGEILLAAGAEDWGWRGPTEMPYVRRLLRLTADGDPTPAGTGVGGWVTAPLPARVPDAEGEDLPAGGEGGASEGGAGASAGGAVGGGDGASDGGQAGGGGEMFAPPGGFADFFVAGRAGGSGGVDPAVFRGGVTPAASPFDWQDDERVPWE